MGFRQLSTRVLLYALAAPWDVILLAFALVTMPLSGVTLHARCGVAWLHLPAQGWLARHWRYSTTLGHVVLLQANAVGTAVEDHELVHVRQFEGAVLSVWLCSASFFLLYANWGALPACLVCSLLGPWWSYFGASCCAWLRSERPYLDNHFERHARAEVALARPVYASSEKGVKSVPRS